MMYRIWRTFTGVCVVIAFTLVAPITYFIDYVVDDWWDDVKEVYGEFYLLMAYLWREQDGSEDDTPA